MPSVLLLNVKQSLKVLLACLQLLLFLAKSCYHLLQLIVLFFQLLHLLHPLPRFPFVVVTLLVLPSIANTHQLLLLALECCLLLFHAP